MKQGKKKEAGEVKAKRGRSGNATESGQTRNSRQLNDKVIEDAAQDICGPQNQSNGQPPERPTEPSPQSMVSQELEAASTRGNSGVLTGEEIQQLQLVKDLDHSLLKSTSCDLRLGSEICVCKLAEKGGGISHLRPEQNIDIESFGRILFSTKERIDLSRQTDIVGRFDLKIGYGLDGLIAQVGPQVEPGYEGPLYGLLINTSGVQKRIREGEELFTIEFSRTSSAPRNVEQRSVASLKDFLRNQTIREEHLLMPSIVEKMKNDLDACRDAHGIKTQDDAERRAHKMFRIGVATLKWAIIAVIAGLLMGIGGIVATLYGQEIKGYVMGLGSSSKATRPQGPTEWNRLDRNVPKPKAQESGGQTDGAYGNQGSKNTTGISPSGHNQEGPQNHE